MFTEIKKSYHISVWGVIALIILAITACRESEKSAESTKVEPVPSTVVSDSSVKKIITPEPPIPLKDLNDTTFVRLADYSDQFSYDIRYATTNNFLKSKVYDCAECYTRVKTAKALIAANNDFIEEGYRIKFFDCYRPNDVQYKMWEIVPNPQYVANPVKGSIHNRGGAVDITLETLEGVELDMGTDFDFFGRRAYHDFYDLPDEVIANRALLKEIMASHGFSSIRSEWWHYNLGIASRDRVANFKWPCPVSDN